MAVETEYMETRCTSLILTVYDSISRPAPGKETNMKKLTRGIFTVIALTLTGALSACPEQKPVTGVQFVSVEEAEDMMNHDSDGRHLVVLDVRTEEEFQSGHIPGAVNIDYKSEDFKDKVSKLDMDKTYITYCRSGRRSALSSEIMNDIGFEKVYTIEGGIQAWSQYGFPVET